MFRKTEILLKTNFKLSTTVTVVVEYLKVIDMGPRPTINSLVKRKKNILLFGGIAVKYLDPSDIHIFHIIFFSVRPYRLTHSFIFFFFCFSSSTLLIDGQPTLSLDGELYTRKWSFFFWNRVFKQGNITTFTNTTSRYIVYDFLSVPFELFDIG